MERISVRRLLRFEKENVTNLRTNGSPQIVLAKFAVPVDWPKLHEMGILLWPRGGAMSLGRPEDQLGTPASRTPDAKKVKGGPRA